MRILRNVPLKNFSTFHLGGNAKYFTAVRTKDELKEAIKWARRAGVPYFILGGGSNVLFSDKGFDGLVIRNQITGRESYKKDGSVFLTAGAGEDWDDFVKETVDRGLYGLENLSGIPGTVGATPVQNVGAYGTEIKDTLAWVEALNADTLETELIRNADCGLGYRDSFFKTSDGKKFIITNVGFRLQDKGVPDLKYRDLQEYFNASDVKPSLQSVRDAVLTIRGRKFPNLNEVGCGGSFFKNPIVSKKILNGLLERFPTMPYYQYDKDEYKIPLAWLLENAVPWKGIRRSKVGVHDAQPLVLVNYGGASSEELKKLSDDITNNLARELNILITPEISFIGSF